MARKKKKKRIGFQPTIDASRGGELGAAARARQNEINLINVKEKERRLTGTSGAAAALEEKTGVKPGEDIKESLRKETPGELGTENVPKGEILTPEALEINSIRNKLAQPETGKVLDTINRWRLEIQLENSLKKQEKTAAGELQPFGAIALGINIGAVTSLGGKAGDGAGRLLGLGQGQQTGGLVGMSSIAHNAKTTALTGTWLKKAGFTVKAAATLGGIIGLVAWGKHVKSEAIEFLPFQITKAREAGDEAGALELEQLHAEIADPTGWANIIEEVPGLGVIKAAIDKTRVGTAIIKAQKKRE